MSSRILRVQGDRLTRGGRPHQVLSATAHYFRIPRQLWADRLRRLAAMGVNTVETYVAWNYHQPQPPAQAPARFDGDADLAEFCRTADALGLDVIVRPGPYICAEWEFGGLPAWLLADPAMRLRCADPAYQAAVDGWLDTLIPRLLPLLATQGGPIVAVQVENEYGSYGNDAAHLEHLRAGLVARGVDVLLFTSDGPTDQMLAGGTLPAVLATVNFGSAPAEAFDLLQRHRPGSPSICMEFWNGWFDHWGEPHHVRAADNAAAVLRQMVDAGASVNIYVGHGGTNFGFWAGANHAPDGYQPTVTSYDYDAPIGEAGELTPKFHAFRQVLAGAAAAAGRTLPEPPAPLPRQRPRTLRTSPAVALLSGPPLLDRLTRPVQVAAPEPMERLGQAYGYIHYRTRLTGPHEQARLRFVGLADRGQVFLDGRLVGVVSRGPHPGDEPELAVDVPAGGADLEVLVENTGRVNYGPHLHDRKGLRQVWLNYQQQFDWQARPLPLTDLAPIRAALAHAEASAGPADTAPPLFSRVTVDLAEGDVADAFVALPDWGRGRVWLNGFCLGAYRAEGPQVTLYAPGPLWRAGSNEVLMLELDCAGSVVEIRDQPDLGPVAAARA